MCVSGTAQTQGTGIPSVILSFGGHVTQAKFSLISVHSTLPWKFQV